MSRVPLHHSTHQINLSKYRCVCVRIWVYRELWFFKLSNLWPLHAKLIKNAGDNTRIYCSGSVCCSLILWLTHFWSISLNILSFSHIPVTHNSTYFTLNLSLPLLWDSVFFFPWSCPSASYNTGAVWSGLQKPPLKSLTFIHVQPKYSLFFFFLNKIPPLKKNVPALFSIGWSNLDPIKTGTPLNFLHTQLEEDPRLEEYFPYWRLYFVRNSTG